MNTVSVRNIAVLTMLTFIVMAVAIIMPLQTVYTAANTHSYNITFLNDWTLNLDAYNCVFEDNFFASGISRVTCDVPVEGSLFGYVTLHYNNVSYLSNIDE